MDLEGYSGSLEPEDREESGTVEKGREELYGFRNIASELLQALG